MSRPPKPLKPKAKVRLGRLSFLPLYEELRQHGLVTAGQIGEFYGYSPALIRKWARIGIGTYLADRMAVKLKVLPWVLWGQDVFFDEELMAVELAGGGRRRAFTDDDVRSIRARYAAGETAQVISRDYGVKYQTVLQVAHGNSYRSVA